LALKKISCYAHKEKLREENESSGEILAKTG